MTAERLTASTVTDAHIQDDLDQLHLRRRSLVDRIAAARRHSTDVDPEVPEDEGDGDPWAEAHRLEAELRVVADEIWRREDSRVSPVELASYQATGATWSDVDLEWPAARATWDRQPPFDVDGGPVHLVIWTRLTAEAPCSGDKPMVPGTRWLLVVDESQACRLQGPLDKGVHGPGCRCRLWSVGKDWGQWHWSDLARDGLVANLRPGRQVEGILLGHGSDAKFKMPLPGGVHQDLTVKTWLVRPSGGRLPLRLLTSRQLDAALPKLVDRAIRLARLPDVTLRTGSRVTQYAVRPVTVEPPGFQ